ncbi:C40 family peptidase [Blastococcus sp. VKM Ac-2987]|uniref:C40 family peptidase n=1 Tax=Blastococcus sp. VKM Ac-2987 TaxID=3004141 RepID=UPI0022ABB912|nr:C40 family peptidase [Blastococcus sp. VKM Ac-2987]MCZ2857127.1 C40 family peptidase [Blastococcus sp. VKM Ac-2987]
MATPHALPTHAPEQFTTVGRRTSPSARRSGPLGSGLLVSAAAALTVTLLPATASAVPGTADEVAAQVAEASHELEVVSEQLNEARVVLDGHRDDARAATEAAEAAQARLDSLDGQVRLLARSAFTGSGMSQLDVLLSSDSADQLVSQLGTLDVIAGHTDEVLSGVSLASADAEQSRDDAAAAAAEAQRVVDEIAAKQEDLETRIAEYQQRYDELTAGQQAEVARAHGGDSLPAPAPSGVVAPSSAAQAAVNTALAQVGDPYIWGAGGPNAFDCSGLTSYAYAAAGVTLPHSSASQSRMGKAVSRGDLQPGDLVFFYSPVSHVGMYIGNGQMVHASTSGQPVKVASLDSMGSYNGARRIAG